MDGRLANMLECLYGWFADKDSILVALSGGVDSSVVAAMAKLAIGEKSVAVTALSPALPKIDLEEAKKVSKYIGIKHLLIKTDEVEKEGYRRNLQDRCYHCKTELFNKLSYIARSMGVKVIADGTNADDVKGHRPGIVAAKECGVRSPLLELGLGKGDVREIARFLGLPNSDKPPMACLSSRIEYGQVITISLLRKVDMAEEVVRGIAGVKQVRVRVHGNIARIEVGKDERKKLFDEGIMDKVHDKIRELGFSYVTLDLAGYRQGSMLKAR